MATHAGTRPQGSLAFDIGSTYVDVLWRAANGSVQRHKHPRRERAPAQAALAAVEQMLTGCGIQPEQVDQVVHGSTIVTNALVDQDVAPAAWLTTRGFADLLRLGRQQRDDLYGAVPLPRVPVTLFPPALCFEVGGRIDAQGHEVEALDLESLERAIDGIAASAARAVGIGLLFAHLNPAHEQAVAQRLRARLPHLALSLSHRVDGQAREYERFLATVLDACVRPVAAAYLDELAAGLARLGLPAARMMRSDASTVALEQARDEPLRLALSGPAAALLAAARGSGSSRLISMDVGGTTTDIGLVLAGEPLLAETLTIGPFEVRQRAVDIVSLPVGGGSLVRLLPGGALRVGPRSAGADPGPVAYGRGGSVPTLTDALLLLERLPATLAGGLELSRDRAHAALAPMAQALQSSVTGLAQAVVDSAAAAIAEGLKQHAFARGFDPAGAVLVAAGGGGAQHAAEVAALLGMHQVRVPASAGLLAAEGLLQAADAPPHTDAPATTQWPGVPASGAGPAALFGPTQSAWIPPGWVWHIDAAGDLCIEAHGNG